MREGVEMKEGVEMMEYRGRRFTRRGRLGALLIAAAIAWPLAGLIDPSASLVPEVHAAPGESQGPAGKAQDGASKSAKVDINKASAKQLESLPGIGPALAARIVSHREQNGKFRRIEELMNVKGVGSKSFERLKGRITVGA